MTRRPFLIWGVVAAVVFLLSSVPAMASGVAAADKGVLLGLHSVVFVVLVAGFRRTTSARPSG
ncbi:DUF6069 family protein [Cryptosporangium aurantiacum]|uniref:Uncharacterized protein n=1 Tax=Cryptosporangium aurantiacum TaxID=134849 RepID=A0A1M7MBF8_9ACTN|nr:DUF6069 family protein [Cryptosporangium aurantiacum]SHM88108.1 hypothetical protein SAMN05443668_10254 [Cryptosporangium aurantiacum]